MRRNATILAVALVGVLAGCSASRPTKVIRVAPLPVVPNPPPETSWEPEPYIPWGEHTVETRLRQFGRAARERWQPWFADAGVPYPPRAVVLVGLKSEQRLQVYAGPSWSRLAFIRDIPWTATSGGPGPKLREGDRQIPEGIYPIIALNPNSRFHVSLRVGYPNRLDRAVAAQEGRTRLGGDIMIHGGAKSVGCVAVGDEGAEDLFTLAADAGLDNIDLLLAPRDFRRAGDGPPRGRQPEWVATLYDRLAESLYRLPQPTITTVGRDRDIQPAAWAP